MVAVRMVSEGVDVPRLSVGVYATSASTPLYFAQAVGRFVRVRHRGETASVFLPSVPRLLGYAAEMEVERDHALSRPLPEDGSPFELEEALVREANRVETAPDGESSAFETLGASARFDRVLYDGGEFGAGGEIGSPEEADFIGLPGLLEPDQVAQLLRRHKVEQAARATDRRSAPPVSAHRALAALRKELNGLVAAWHHRTGTSHAEVHAALRRDCGGPPLAQASSEQVQQRIDRLRDWAVGRRG
jgi:superfamily II DNA or RNA helicase